MKHTRHLNKNRSFISYIDNLMGIAFYPATENEERRFFSFHKWGILVYEPSACRPRHEIRSTDVIPGTQVRSATSLHNIRRTKCFRLSLSVIGGALPL